MKRIKILLITIGILFITIFLWWNEGIKPVGEKDTTIRNFNIKEGESLRTIAKKLKDEGLIRNQIVFFLDVKMKNLDKKIQAGKFELSRSMNVTTIIEALNHGTTDEWITIPEGWRNEEIAAKLNELLSIPPKDFLNYAKIGYMFPDTYRVPKNSTGMQIAAIMQETFNQKWQEIDMTPRQKNKLTQNLTDDQIVILASIIEREAGHPEDFPIIARILLKRLQSQMPLGVDATIQYALKKDTTNNTWWKQDLTVDDLEIDSPYNTRKYNTLPPTPISNPGIRALKAVILNEDTPYWFYISDKQGTIHYAKTLEEHNRNIYTYLSGN